MKTYMDFITDITTNAGLLQDLELVLPFPNTEALMVWFSHRGYSLGDGDALMLYQHQGALMDSGEPIHY
jgi:hypothetical protein